MSWALAVTGWSARVGRSPSPTRFHELAQDVIRGGLGLLDPWDVLGGRDDHMVGELLCCHLSAVVADHGHRDQLAAPSLCESVDHAQRAAAGGEGEQSVARATVGDDLTG